jgi:colanic acid biosynthesis protein WcaH
MNEVGKLADLEFEHVIRDTPLVAIDLIVRLKDGKFLLGHRTNEPAKDLLFVPGGRIFKNENVDDAFQRITEKEIGVKCNRKEAIFLGVFDHYYETNFFKIPNFGTRYVVLAYELTLTEEQELPSDQHDRYVCLEEEDILNSCTVHENTKAYFRLKTIRSETQYTAVSIRRNASNTLLWQTPALSLTALAFLLNVTANKNAYWGVRVATSILGVLIVLVTFQLFLRHRRFEAEESCMLGDFELRNRHIGYAPINKQKGSASWISRLTDLLFEPFQPIANCLADCKSHKWWTFLFIVLMGGSLWLTVFTFMNRGNVSDESRGNNSFNGGVSIVIPRESSPASSPFYGPPTQSTNSIPAHPVTGSAKVPTNEQPTNVTPSN